MEGSLGILAAEVPPAAIFIGALALYFATEAAVITAVDEGQGVYLSMLWITPSIFLPTAIV